MRIKALVTIYAGGALHAPGTVFEHDEAEASRFIAGGFAEGVDATPGAVDGGENEGGDAPEDPAPEAKKRRR